MNLSHRPVRRLRPRSDRVRRPRSGRSLRAARSLGFTLIELMVAILVSSIVVLGLFAFSTIQQSTAGLHDRNVRIQQSLEGAMWSLGQDVRSAGLGFARLCTELRVWDARRNALVNPGGAASPSLAAVDPITLEPYWALRDGFHAHWKSTTSSGTALAALYGANNSSADYVGAADSFDVLLGERNYVSAGIFQYTAHDAGAGTLTMTSGAALGASELAQVQQLFPPGSFIALVNLPTSAEGEPFKAELQEQCPLVQVTGDVTSAGGQTWTVPIGTSSGFNANLGALLGGTAVGVTDWDTPLASGDWIVPLGQLRWSRYEIDYTVPAMPYLVRYDFIAAHADKGEQVTGVGSYPHCNGSCPLPQLHLPDLAAPDNAPRAVAVGPMIEDLQVAVGCDGWLNASTPPAIPLPDPTFAEVGPASGPTANVPNLLVDENTNLSGQRGADEWLGNARNETWAPDCVYYGTGEYNAANWALEAAPRGGATPGHPPAFRMSPQTIRITVLGTTDTSTANTSATNVGLATDQLMAVEDRPAMTSPAGSAGIRERLSLTEVFTPRNLRWRNPAVP